MPTRRTIRASIPRLRYCRNKRVEDKDFTLPDSGCRPDLGRCRHVFGVSVALRVGTPRSRGQLRLCFRAAADFGAPPLDDYLFVATLGRLPWWMAILRSPISAVACSLDSNVDATGQRIHHPMVYVTLGAGFFWSSVVCRLGDNPSHRSTRSRLPLSLRDGAKSCNRWQRVTEGRDDQEDRTAPRTVVRGGWISWLRRECRGHAIAPRGSKSGQRPDIRDR